MLTLLLALILIVFGLFYHVFFQKKEPTSIGISLMLLVVSCLIGSYIHHPELDFSIIFGDYPLLISKILLLLSFFLTWLIMKKNLQMLSWLALAFPAAFLLIPNSNSTEHISNMSYVMVFGMGTLYPLIVHFLGALILNFPMPQERAFQEHKQSISLLLATALLAILIVMANFVLGFSALYILAVGIFSSAIMFRPYNLNGQKSFPSLVMVLLSFALFSLFSDMYKDDLNFQGYQVFSGLMFGTGALFLAAITFSWANESSGFFNKLLLFKSVAGPIVFIAISGFLFFVYEAFGGRMSVMFSLIGAALVLPVVNIWFQNRAYGGMAIILGMAILIMPYLEHDKSQAEILIQEENINFDLPKLKMLNEFGEEQESKLNDISLAHGLWQLDSSNSIVEFQIEGTDGVTDGFFKRLKGSTEIGDSLGVIKLDIEIPIAGISTYNKTRDKSIRKDEDFFDEAKYPVMRYVVNGMRVVEDNYVALGAFTMRGVSLPLETNMMFSGQGTINGKEVIILEGSGILDRTAFGQMPDATIGNELKFSYKAIFTK